MTLAAPNGFTKAVRRFMAFIAGVVLTIIWGSYGGAMARSYYLETPVQAAPPLIFSAFLLLVALSYFDIVADIARHMFERAKP